MKKKYRIVTDQFCGFCVQVKYPWLWFWVDMDGPNGIYSNSFHNVEEAETWLNEKKKKFKSKTVKYL